MGAWNLNSQESQFLKQAP